MSLHQIEMEAEALHHELGERPADLLALNENGETAWTVLVAIPYRHRLENRCPRTFGLKRCIHYGSHKFCAVAPDHTKRPKVTAERQTTMEDGQS